MNLLNVKEVAAMLHVSHITIYRFTKPDSKYFDESFPQPIKIGRSTVWHKEEIEEWVRNAPRGADNNVNPCKRAAA